MARPKKNVLRYAKNEGKRVLSETQDMIDFADASQKIASAAPPIKKGMRKARHLYGKGKKAVKSLNRKIFRKKRKSKKR